MTSSSRYRIGPRLGLGAFAEVIRAYDRAQGRWLALKRTGERGGVNELRLRVEAEALAAIRHENVVTLEAWVEDDHWCGYTMELLTDGNARAWVREECEVAPSVGQVGRIATEEEGRPRRTLPLAFGQPLQDVGASDFQWAGAAGEERLVRWLLDTAAALAAVHATGWLHLDVTPENIRLRDNRCVLTDFGSACRGSTIRTPLPSMVTRFACGAGDGPGSRRR